MACVLDDNDVQQETQYRWLVADSMVAIPNDVNFVDGFDLLSHLYHPSSTTRSTSLSSIITEPIAIGKFESLVLEKIHPPAFLAREAMSDEQQERQYRRAITNSMYSIPHTIDFKEGFILLSILYRTGLYEPTKTPLVLGKENSGYDSDSTEMYCLTINNNGRIISLTLGDYGNPWSDTTFDLLLIIEGFQMLRYLSLDNCRSIPAELSNLPLLEVLHIRKFEGSSFDEMFIPRELQLSSLKKITCDMSELPRALLALLMFRLPNLEELTLRGLFCNDHLHDLINSDNDCCFRHTLTTFEIDIEKSDENLIECDLEALLFDFLPRFPNLRTLVAGVCEVETLTTIEDRIKNNSSLLEPIMIPNNRLRRLELTGNGTESEIMGKIKSDPKERAALLTILETFNEISSLGSCYDICGRCPEVDYVLSINKAGRKYIMSGGGGNDGAAAAAAAAIYIKPALWPRIFERANTSIELWNNKKKLWDTALFYLIQHGPVLQDIIAMRGGEEDSDSAVVRRDTLQVSDYTNSQRQQGRKRKK